MINKISSGQHGMNNMNMVQLEQYEHGMTYESDDTSMQHESGDTSMQHDNTIMHQLTPLRVTS